MDFAVNWQNELCVAKNGVVVTGISTGLSSRTESITRGRAMQLTPRSQLRPR